MADDLKHVLQRTQDLDEAIVNILDPETYELCDDSDRVAATFTACSVSLEHGDAVRILMEAGCPTSAISLVRLQHEAIARANWFLYAASDAAIEKVQAPLTTASEKAANSLLGLSDMLTALAGKGPPGATEMLIEFKNVIGKSLNSYVHSGIHAIQRHHEGHPMSLLIDAVRNSNGLRVMTAMMLAILSGDEVMAKRMSKIQPGFADCLPILLPRPAPPSSR